MGKVSKLLKIDNWTPKPNQRIVEPDNKIFLCHFDKVFQQPKLDRYNKFYIQKLSYINNLDLITKYINYFINCYDSDNELISAYLKIKFETDEKRSFDENNMEAYISFLYVIISMILRVMIIKRKSIRKMIRNILSHWSLLISMLKYY